MNLSVRARSRFYAPLLAVLEQARSSDSVPAETQPPAEPELAHDDFEETRPIVFVSGTEGDPAVNGSTA
jgi:hypothetical protein